MPSAREENGRERECAARKARRRRGREYAEERGTKRACVGEVGGPRRGVEACEKGEGHVVVDYDDWVGFGWSVARSRSYWRRRTGSNFEGGIQSSCSIGD